MQEDVVCFQYTQIHTGIIFYVLQAGDDAICIAKNGSERTTYESLDVEFFDRQTPRFFTKKEWSIPYVLTLYDSIYGRNRAVLKKVANRKELQQFDDKYKKDAFQE